MISVFGQWSGNGLGYFNSTIYDTLGYKSSSTQLLLNLVNSIVSAIAAGTAVCLTDKMPRRPVLIWGTLGKWRTACFSNLESIGKGLRIISMRDCDGDQRGDLASHR